MKRTLLLTSAAVALALGLTPALAQGQADSKTKRDSAATEQHHNDANRQSQKANPEHSAKQNTNKENTNKENTKQNAQSSDNGSSRKAANDDKKGSRETTGQADNDKAKPSDANAANAKPDQSKSADKENKTDEPKRAEDRNQKPSDKSAADKKGANESSKSAEQKGAGAPSAQKSTQTNAPNQNGQASKSGKAETQAPSRNTAETKSGNEPKERIAATLAPQKKERLITAIDKVKVKPVTHVNFAVSVGTVVPHAVDLRPVPTTIVEIVPQYRGYDFFVVRDRVVIVEPRTHRIVDVIERGPSRARATTTTERRLRLSAHQREIIRRHAKSRRTVTTGAAPRTTTEITVGETLPEAVEIESFPTEVYREVPEVRSYRYIERGDDVYLVDPSTRRVIEEVR